MKLKHTRNIQQKGYEQFIPLDKSWLTRVGVLDIIHGYNDIEKILDKQIDLGEDLLALKRASQIWGTDSPVDVGESATLYRLLQFASWKFNLNKKFIRHGTLKDRIMTDNPNIINLELKELLKLDNQTTQWASASIISGNKERVPNSPNKLQQTYDAVDHWNKQRQLGLVWESKYDETIEKQAEVFLKIQKGLKAVFTPMHSEDYCFARVFGYMTKEQGEKEWPSLRGHETDRIEEMEKAITQAQAGQTIDSKDHRVVQAIAMWGMANDKKFNFTHPEAVNKSWPKFWEFLNI